MKYFLLLLTFLTSISMAASFPTYEEIRKTNESLGQLSGTRIDEVTKINAVVMFANQYKKTIGIIYSIDVELKLNKQQKVEMLRLLDDHQQKVKSNTCKNYNSMFKHYKDIKSFDMTFKYFDYTGVNFGNSKFNCYRYGN